MYLTLLHQFVERPTINVPVVDSENGGNNFSSQIRSGMVVILEKFSVMYIFKNQES